MGRLSCLPICAKLIILQTKLAGVSETALSRFLAQARRAAGVKGKVAVLITSSAEMHELNRRFRRKNRPTDVLSFPSIAAGIAGDIAISCDIARDSSRRLGHSLDLELRVLILHGILHLAGYDHHDDNGRMARKENALRKQLKLPAALIERAKTSVETVGARAGTRRTKPERKKR